MTNEMIEKYYHDMYESFKRMLRCDREGKYTGEYKGYTIQYHGLFYIQTGDNVSYSLGVRNNSTIVLYDMKNNSEIFGLSYYGIETEYNMSDDEVKKMIIILIDLLKEFSTRIVKEFNASVISQYKNFIITDDNTSEDDGNIKKKYNILKSLFEDKEKYIPKMNCKLPVENYIVRYDHMNSEFIISNNIRDMYRVRELTHISVYDMVHNVRMFSFNRWNEVSDIFSEEINPSATIDFLIKLIEPYVNHLIDNHMKSIMSGMEEFINSYK